MTLLIDGEPLRLALRDGLGDDQVPSLGEGGDHRVELVDAAPDLVLVRATAEYGVPWSAPPPLVGPFVLSVEGEVGQVDDRSGLRLVVRSRVPRVICTSVVEVSLPAGAEIDEEARQRVASPALGEPRASAETLTLRLGPIAPRASVEVPLPWLWTTAGELQGLGAIAYAADRPEAISIIPARRVEVRRRGAGAEVSP